MWFFGRSKKLKAELEQRERELEALKAKLVSNEMHACGNAANAPRTSNLFEKYDPNVSESNRRLTDFVSIAMNEASDLKESIIREAREEAQRIEEEGRKRRDELISEAQNIEREAQEKAQRLEDEGRKRRDELISEGQNAEREAKEKAQRLEEEGRRRRDELISEGHNVDELTQAAVDKAVEQARDQAVKDAERTIRDAQNAVSEAERLSKQMLDEAEKTAHAMIDEAEKTAHTMINEAEKTANTMIGDADAQVKKRETQIDELNERLRARAKMALEDAEFYADTLDSLPVGRGRRRGAHRIHSEDMSAGGAQASEYVAPESYENAASLMHSIYAIEGRELPGDEYYDDEYCDDGDAANDEGDGSEDFSMPVDPNFADIVGEVLK